MAEFNDHFSSRAADYAAFRPLYPSALVAWLATLPSQRRLALDCGCGAGQLSVPLAASFDRVVATDASAEQIGHAAPHPRVEYRAAPAERTGLADGEADLITVAQAAHWFDLDAFYAEARRTLAPGGAIALITYGVIEADGSVGAILRHFHDEVLGVFWPAGRKHVETGYRLLPFPFREENAPEFAMRASWTLAEVLGYVDTWSALRKAEATLGRKPFEDFCAGLRAAWGPADGPREIRRPLTVRAGRM